jgi:hypothetical protein
MAVEYDLGTLTVIGHDAENLPQAFGISDERLSEIVNLVERAWDYGERISESIEYLARNSSGSELVLALILLGRSLEDNQNNDNEDDEE